MKFNGAVEPHHEDCRTLGHSSGAKKYRKKQCKRHVKAQMQRHCIDNCDNSSTPLVYQYKRRIAQKQKQQHELKQDLKELIKNKKRKILNGYFKNNFLAAMKRTIITGNIIATTITRTTSYVARQDRLQEEEEQRFAKISACTKEDHSATKMQHKQSKRSFFSKIANILRSQTSLQLLLLQLLIINSCISLMESFIVLVMFAVRVTQSLVPKICYPLQKLTAATVATIVEALTPAKMKKCVRHPGSHFFVYKPAKLTAMVFCLISPMIFYPNSVMCDDGDNFFAVNSFSMGPEPTPAEFDYASRGQKKFGDKCDNTLECGFPGSICDPKKKSCQCTEDLPVTNHIDKCGKEAAVNESCFFNEQCEVKYFQTECRDGRCVCRFEMTPIWLKDGTIECKGRQEKRGPETYIDPAMIGVLLGMALMFVIICVVLRLFSQARWRENRTIFNTPNPRLMNVSLLRESKLLHGQERRGSRMSVRAPSRQPSMASLRPHSPNPSLGKTGSNSNSGSNASATSLRSNRSNSVAPGHAVNTHHERKGSTHHHDTHHNQQQHLAHQHPHHAQQSHHHNDPQPTNITANPADESVTVEIIVPERK